MSFNINRYAPRKKSFLRRLKTIFKWKIRLLKRIKKTQITKNQKEKEVIMQQNEEIKEKIQTEVKQEVYPVEKKELSKNKTIIIVVAILAIAYIYVEKSKINYQEKIRVEENAKIEYQKDALKTCLSDAFIDYNTNWNDQCKSIGKKKDCSLPRYRANDVEKWYSDSKKQCMQKFENKAF